LSAPRKRLQGLHQGHLLDITPHPPCPCRLPQHSRIPSTGLALHSTSPGAPSPALCFPPQQPLLWAQCLPSVWGRAPIDCGSLSSSGWGRLGGAASKRISSSGPRGEKRCPSAFRVWHSPEAGQTRGGRGSHFLGQGRLEGKEGLRATGRVPHTPTPPPAHQGQAHQRHTKGRHTRGGTPGRPPRGRRDTRGGHPGAHKGTPRAYHGHTRHTEGTAGPPAGRPQGSGVCGLLEEHTRAYQGHQGQTRAGIQGQTRGTPAVHQGVPGCTRGRG